MKNKNLIISIISFAVMLIVMFSTLLLTDNKDLQEYVVKETIDTITQIAENESTTEIPELTEDDEKAVEVQETEDESFELQGEIAYEGDARTWNLTTGDTPQLTYISQIDSRWKNYPYTSTGNRSQTIGSSGCGVASGAMIIDSIVGNVDVKDLADCFVNNGYRSANNGTYWSAYRAIADEFNIGYQETSSLDNAVNLIRNSNYVIASCGNGLFTSSGHYIVIYGIEGDTLKIYDPYLYSGKFDTSTRRNKVTVSGNTVYCSISNFRNYANYKQFFCYSYDPSKVVKTNFTDYQVTTANYTRYVATNSSSLNVRNGASLSSTRIGSLRKGTRVTVTATSGNWSKISSPISGWVNSSYLSGSTNTNKVVTGYKTGTYKTTSNLHVRSGAGTNYRAKTYKQLSGNARSQNKRFGNQYYNGYKKGVTCTVTKVSGNWGLTKSGWICLSYCRKI